MALDDDEREPIGVDQSSLGNEQILRVVKFHEKYLRLGRLSI